RVYGEHFPNGYSPLLNNKVIVTQLEEYQALENYYKEWATDNKQEEQEEELKGESQEKDSE
ncbi:hypothetical protein ACR2XU_28115, partial [Klebsiella pneumoniae]